MNISVFTSHVWRTIGLKGRSFGLLKGYQAENAVPLSPPTLQRLMSLKCEGIIKVQISKEKEAALRAIVSKLKYSKRQPKADSLLHYLLCLCVSYPHTE